MFYQCPKCKKTWQHPIDKCPWCFDSLQRVQSKEAEVIEITKVNVPSLYHPRVPYFIVLLKDEYGNRWVRKTTQEYKPGDKISVSKSKPSVCVERVKYDFLEPVEQLMNNVGNLDITPKTNVLLLPTLNLPVHPYLAENTSPEMLEAVANFLMNQGVKNENIGVAGQSFNSFPIEDSAKKSGLLDVALNNRLSFINLSQEKFKKAKDFRISEKIWNWDLVINLPMLRTDKEMGARGPVENLMKFLDPHSYHRLNYLYEKEEFMPEVLEELPPRLINLADANIVQRADSSTRFLGLALASFRATYLERVFAEICEIKRLPSYLKEVDMDEVSIIGRQIPELQMNIENYC